MHDKTDVDDDDNDDDDDASSGENPLDSTSTQQPGAKRKRGSYSSQKPKKGEDFWSRYDAFIKKKISEFNSFDLLADTWKPFVVSIYSFVFHYAHGQSNAWQIYQRSRNRRYQDIWTRDRDSSSEDPSQL
jgi:hypothetical protein